MQRVSGQHAPHAIDVASHQLVWHALLHETIRTSVLTEVGMLLKVLSLMLSQQHLSLIAFPDASFTLTNWTSKGYQCVLDKTPRRELDIQVSRLFRVGHAGHICCYFQAVGMLYIETA